MKYYWNPGELILIYHHQRNHSENKDALASIQSYEQPRGPAYGPAEGTGTKALTQGLIQNLLSHEEGSDGEIGGNYMSNVSWAGQVESKRLCHTPGEGCAQRPRCITQLR